MDGIPVVPHGWLVVFLRGTFLPAVTVLVLCELGWEAKGLQQQVWNDVRVAQAFLPGRLLGLRHWLTAKKH